MLRAHEQAVELLRSLGHELVERDPAYPPWLGPHLVARYLRGAYESATDIGNVERWSSAVAISSAAANWW